MSGIMGANKFCNTGSDLAEILITKPRRSMPLEELSLEPLVFKEEVFVRGVEDADRCHLHLFPSLPSFRIEARPGKRRSPVNCQIKIFPDFIRAVDGVIYRYWVLFWGPHRSGLIFFCFFLHGTKK